MICDVCHGRGWIRSRTVPAVHCNLCDGRGEVSWGQVARKIDEDPGTLARVRQLRCRPETAQRVLDKVCKLLWPRGQQGLFS